MTILVGSSFLQVFILNVKGNNRISNLQQTQQISTRKPVTLLRLLLAGRDPGKTRDLTEVGLNSPGQCFQLHKIRGMTAASYRSPVGQTIFRSLADRRKIRPFPSD